ncbi:GPI inositol-deacylase [Neocloeon triangulifer]|uniref:GPI inositol-deacylase n=1 Tax=Neocloeon triangulifer TaxID=2078957 RepID=UPI00286F71A7|nr:GPI inositol-deacylase [Neocloeon triangulifer]
MAAFNLFIAISGVIFALFVLGIHNYLTAHEENSCEMTYMFEYPQYVKIALSDNDTKEFPKYGLYAYGEGQYTEKLRNMQFNGIPVLFVPGNSGSYKQVRSLASVALRKARDSRSQFHFNFFTADLNEEHSALFGGVLAEQTRFISVCINKILSLYGRSRNPPKSVLLFGHSMGGMVAKGVFLEPDFVPGSVNTVLTLATPHSSPVMILDPYVASYYQKVNSLWEIGDPNRLLISVGGGHRDLLVRSGLTLQGNVSTLSTAVPAVWVSADHLCILWCKQLVLSLARALFDSVDPKTKLLTDDAQIRHQAFSYHLLHRNFGKRVTDANYPLQAEFDKEGEWREYLKRQFTVKETHLKKPVYIMVRILPNDLKHEFVAIEAIGLEKRDWVYGCNADLVYKHVRMCERGINLSNFTQFVPSLMKRRKSVTFNLHSLKKHGISHIIVKIPTSTSEVLLNFDVFSREERILQVESLPPIYSTSAEEIVATTAVGALYYQLQLPSLEKAWHAASFVFEANCAALDHHAVATLATDWSTEDSHAFVTSTVSQRLPLKLHLLRPNGIDKNATAHITLQLDPLCTYNLKIEPSQPMILGQLVRFYAPQLPAYLVAVLLLALRAQLDGVSQGNTCIAFHSAIASGSKPYFLMPILKISVHILRLGPVAKIFPMTDWVLLYAQGLDMFFLPLILYCVASFAAYVFGLAVWIAVLVWGTTANKILVKFISRSLFGGFRWSEWVLGTFAKLPCAVAFLLVALAYATCGALALAAGLCFYFLLVVKMYEEYLEELLKVPLRLIKGQRTEIWGRSETFLSELHFHCTGLLLWAVTTGLHAPCALAWARAFPFGTRLSPDPSLAAALALCVCAPVLWQRQMPRQYLKHSQEMSVILFGVAAVGLIFAPVSLYRLSPFLVAAFMLVCLQQLMAKQVLPAPESGTPAPAAAITEKAEADNAVAEEKLKQN